VVYRLFNAIQTWTYIGQNSITVADFDKDQLRIDLNTAKGSERTIWTSGHRVSAMAQVTYLCHQKKTPKKIISFRREATVEVTKNFDLWVFFCVFFFGLVSTANQSWKRR